MNLIDFRKLIEEIFNDRRSKKIKNWDSATLAVIKNRLLDLTERKFDHRHYGEKSLLKLLEKDGRLDISQGPTFTVHWKSAEDALAERPSPRPPAESPLASNPTTKKAPVPLGAPYVRQDLWDSIVDFKSGKMYVWDQKKRRARPRRDDERLPVLPTLSRAEMDEWRSEFVGQHSRDMEGAGLAQLLRWKEQALPNIYLPHSLQDKWQRLVTSRVKLRLQRFFEEQTPAIESPSESGAGQSGTSPAPIQPSVDEDAVRSAKSKGQTFLVGEILARAFKDADADSFEDLVARTIAAWSSTTDSFYDPSSVEDLAAHIAAIPEANLALALVTTLQRIKVAGREVPPGLSDIAFKVRDTIAEIYDVSAKKAPIDTAVAAAAKAADALAQLEAAKDAFLKTTPATAKSGSVDVLKRAHMVRSYLISAERNLLRELEIVLGAAFRKFCEAHERNDSEAVVRRAPELKENLQRYGVTPGDPRTASLLWQRVVDPVMQHLAALIEDATEVGEASVAPVLRLSNPTTKIDLSKPNREVRLTFTLLNAGRGQALNIQFVSMLDASIGRIALVEPKAGFALAPEAEQLISLALTVTGSMPELAFGVRWTCETTMGSQRRFEDRISVTQQSSEPNWTALQERPPYSLNPIRTRKQLFGRDATLGTLTLAAMSGASTFLWGQKRIGKTSLLQVLAAELAERPNTACTILRMGEITSLHEGQLAYLIATRLVEAANAQDVTVPREEDFGASMSRLVPFIEALTRKREGVRMVVIIDEFDDLDSSFYTGERGRQFIKALRSLSEIGITFFFVGSERMDAIYGRHQSDLNKWRNVALDRIDQREDCSALITEPVRGAIEYSPVAVDFIIDYCAGNPFYIHHFCYQLFERCVQERKTFVDENDVQLIRQVVLQSLGPYNFAHFWEDNPELDVALKRRQMAENCIALCAIARMGGRYDSVEQLYQAQEDLPIGAEHRASVAALRHACERLVSRKIVGVVRDGEGYFVALPVFREWLAENAERYLLPMWVHYQEKYAAPSEEEQRQGALLLEGSGFPIQEDELLAVSQKLLYCGRQKDVAEIRQWLKQFDDDSRVEIAFMLLKRIADRGYITEGSKSLALNRLSEMIQAKRKAEGGGAWRVVRGRLDNLCVTYVDSELKSGAATARDVQKMLRPGKCGSAGEIATWMKSHVGDDSIVIVVDDFAGTGKTLADGLGAFKRQIEAAIWARYTKERRIATFVMFAFPESIRRAQEACPEVEVVAANILGDDVRALDEEAGIFADEQERRFAGEVLTQVGRELLPGSPLGFGDLGALVVFYDATPNNTLPIFWCNGIVNERPWVPLFPRA